MTVLTTGVYGLNQVYQKIKNSSWESYDPSRTPGTLWTWGYGLLGGLGDGAITPRSSPVQIPGTNWTSVTGGAYAMLGIRSSSLWAWGNNDQGQLGQGDIVHRSSPVQIPGTWETVSICEQTVLAIRDQQLWVWGKNNVGQLGDGTRTAQSSPVQISGLWRQGVTGTSYSGGIRTDGTLWMWGFNRDGVLGQGDLVHRSSPVQVPGANWSTLTLGRVDAFGTRSDGTLWSWGDNSKGGLGDGTITHRSSPVQIPGTNWVGISMKGGELAGAGAVRSDGTLWTWGDNTNGQLGDGTRTHRSSPVQVPGTNWVMISGGDGGLGTMIATRSDFSLWAWGANGKGELGQGDIVHRSSPVQVPGSWIRVNYNGANYARSAIRAL